IPSTGANSRELLPPDPVGVPASAGTPTRREDRMKQTVAALLLLTGLSGCLSFLNRNDPAEKKSSASPVRAVAAAVPPAAPLTAPQPIQTPATPPTTPLVSSLGGESPPALTPLPPLTGSGAARPPEQVIALSAASTDPRSASPNPTPVRS